MAAAPQNKVKLSLNLAIPQGLPQKLPIRFLKWLISYGRFIAILVEIIVITAFIFRFRYDSQLTDLNEKINKDQVPFIKSLASDEANIKQTQYKLSTIGNIYSQSPNWGLLLSYISKEIPQGVKLSSINLGRSSGGSKGINLKLNGTALTNADLANFVYGLKTEPNLKNIYLSNIAFEEGQIAFTITGEGS